MTEAAFQNFIAEATEYLEARVADAQETFGIGQFERYDCDLPAGRFWWTDGGVIQVEAKLIVVGSISTESDTWLWAWANPHLIDVEMEDIERVKDFGLKHRIKKLTEQKWDADEVDGWEMTAVAARLLETECSYRCPSPNGFLYLLLTSLRRVGNGGSGGS